MAIFKYTLPSGSQFRLEAPAGTTQAQADLIFYEQVAAGALVGYETGQTLTSPASKVTKFELSRLDRETAGVDTVPILAIIQGLPVANGIANPQSILSAIQALPIPVSFPNLGNVALTNPIDEADIVLIGGDDLTPDSVGPLNSYQVQKLLAQTAALVDQESDQISQTKGIGRFGFTAYALEQAGYVKPGTSIRFFAVDPEDFVSVMSSPSVWTGKDGIYSLTDLLDSSTTQNQIQVRLMQQGYNQLLANGTISTITKPAISVSTGQVYTNGGLQSVQALSGIGLLSNLGRLNAPGLTGGILQNLQTSGTPLNRLLSAGNLNLSTIGSGAVNNLTAGVGNLGNLANANFSSLAGDLGNRVTGGVGALVTNASKFGSEATALWAKSGGVSGLTNLSGTQLGNLAGNLTGGLTGNLNQITGQLTNLVPGSLSNLTSSLDVFGKAGTFATNFANPLGSLNNLGGLLTSGGGIGGALTGQLGGLTGQLGSLQGALTGQLGGLTSGLTSQLGGLTSGLTSQLGGLTGALGNLGGLANLGSIGGLFGGGGDLVSGTRVAAGFNNTVNRATVDAAAARVAGSSKIPLPTFQYPSLAALAPRLDIQQAQNFLQNQLRSATAGVGQFLRA